MKAKKNSFQKACLLFTCVFLKMLDFVKSDVVVTSRTILQRQNLCSSNALIKQNFDQKKRGINFALLWKNGFVNGDNRTCVVDYTQDDGASGLFATDCTMAISDQTVWQWIDGSYEEEFCNWFGFNCFIERTNYVQLALRPQQFTYWGSEETADGSDRGTACLPIDKDSRWHTLCPNVDQATQQNFINTYSIDVAYCPCGLDMAPFGCEDINECLENHGCPLNSNCINTRSDYRCTCRPGYMNPVNYGSDATKEGPACILGTLFNVSASDVGHDKFSTGITSSGNNGMLAFTLYAIADYVNDMEVEVKRHTQRLNFSNGVMFTGVPSISKSLVLDQISPGTRYKMELVLQDGAKHYSNIITTKCYCEIENGDNTGIPINAIAEQTEGHVTFRFNDNSRCESAYSFARSKVLPSNGTNIQAAESFTSDYYYYSKQVCAGDPYVPGLEASDNLKLSNLIVGNTYYYLIRAAAQQPWRNSNPAIVPWTIRWEASIIGKVSIATGSGGLPIEGVTVEYQLWNTNSTILISSCNHPVNSWCNTTTASSGRFQINFLINNALLNNVDEYPVKLRFAKKTGTIDHRFYCSEGTRDCSAKLLLNRTIEGNPTKVANIYLQHLEFGSPMDVVDDTTIPFRGAVTVAGTKYSGKDLGCPLVGVKVCLDDHSISNQYGTDNSICTETNSEGNYELPAVIGSIVSPKARFRNHTFVPYNSSHLQLFDKGIEIIPNGIYGGYNLQDTTLANVTVDVAGGWCDRTLGVTTLLMKMQGCAWPGQTMTQTFFRSSYNVIAQVLDFEVVSVTDPTSASTRSIISDALKGTIKSVDLQGEENKGSTSATPDSVNDNKADKENSLLVNTTESQALKEKQTDSSQSLDLMLIRFQYNGKDNIQTQFGTMATDTCGEDEGDADTYSYHVLSKLETFLLVITVSQEYGYDIPVCTKYSPDTTVTIQNQVGASAGDSDWLQRMNDSSLSQTVPFLQKCNPSCTRTLLFDANGEDAYFVEVLVAGQPNPVAPHKKSIFVKLDTSGVSHKSDVVVTGDYELPGGFSVAVPTHKPILAIRDPPGGGSYSYYNNMKTTIRLTLENYESFGGFGGSAGVEFGTSTEGTACAGMGVMACVKMLEIEKTVEVTYERGAEVNMNLWENTNQASLTTTWSYTTSSDQWSAGTMSDVFLVPSFNVMFKQITEVLWDNTACASSVEKLKFALDSPDNKPAISFLTYFTIQNTEIPILTRLRDAAQKNVTSLAGCPQILPTNIDAANLLDDDCESALANRDAMQNGIDNWEKFLDRHDNISTLAKKGLLDRTPYTWAKSLQAVGGMPSDMDHYSGLIPMKLAQNAISVQDGNQTKNSTELQVINVIRFDGGGSSFAFELDDINTETHMEKMPVSNISDIFKNSAGYQSVGGTINAKVASAVFVGGTISGQLNSHYSRVATQQDDKSEETAIGFVLSDPDVGDVFVVEIYLDPDHGTFVFNTNSGYSKCPHEDGTVPQELGKIQLKSGTTRLVTKDDSLVYKVELTNVGIANSTFQLYTSYPTDLVSQFVSQVDVSSKETVTTTIKLSAGLDYDYEAVELKMSSVCEYEGSSQEPVYDSITLFNIVDQTLPDSEQRRIRFAKPCPGIVWAGSLALERTFRIRLSDRTINNTYSVNVDIRNPGAAYGSYADKVADLSSRLISAGLWFRRIGSATWLQAFHRPLSNSTTRVIIDFTKLDEDDFGYISVQWDVTGLADGDYELEARSLCSDSTGMLPTDYMTVFTDRLSGRFDRVGPILFGLPQPSTLLYPGDAVTFNFVDELDCTQPHVFRVSLRIGAHPLHSFNNFAVKNLLVTCEGTSIGVALDPFKVGILQLAGSNMTVNLTGVRDLNGNGNKRLITNTFHFASWNVMNATTTFSTVMIPPGSNRLLKSTSSSDIDNIRDYVANMANITSKRVKVSFQQCQDDYDEMCDSGNLNSPIIDIEIIPPLDRNNDINNQEINEHDSINAYHIFQDNVLNGTMNDASFTFHDISQPIVVFDDIEESKRHKQRNLDDASSSMLSHHSFGSNSYYPTDSFSINNVYDNNNKKDNCHDVTVNDHQSTKMDDKINEMNEMFEQTTNELLMQNKLIFVFLIILLVGLLFIGILLIVTLRKTK